MQFKNSDHHQSTEDLLRELKNTAKGNLLEAHYSKVLEHYGIPLLVSSKVLREYGCGQIDLAIFSNSLITVFEVKNTKNTLGTKQKKRLLNSLELLTNIFDASGQLKILNCLPKD